MGILNKMTQFKDKTAKVVLANGTSMIPTGLFMYPVLMAADIMLYDADYVAVGIDQKQHVELTRDLAEKMNKKYGQLFKVSEPLIPEHGAKIMDLLNPTIKMSKSNANENGTIFLLDSIASITKKIMGAKTDSLNKVNFDIVNQPGISNLLNIYSCLSGESIEKIVKQYRNKNYGEFKRSLTDIVIAFISKFQTQYNKILKDESKLEKQLAINAEKCIKLTEAKMLKVNKAIGINK
jgi:tryptophanyl-tRNA synthetase